jgi:hypothetical protein
MADFLLDCRGEAKKMTMRKLPGHRRGLFFGSSLWAEDDHLLLLASSRFQESYKRFYLRDIQAIVVTQSPRYLISTRSGIIGAVLLFAMLVPVLRVPAGILLATLTITWLVISMRYSCRCRLHTAVSAEDLKSVYRTWTAHNFLAEVDPLIRGAQGEMPANAAEIAIPDRTAPLPSPAPPDGRNATAASNTLLVTLIAGAIFTAWQLGNKEPDFVWMTYILLLAQVGSAIWTIVDHRRDRLSKTALGIAIASLVFIGLALYAQVLTVAFVQANAARAGLDPVTDAAARQSTAGILLRQIFAGGCALLGITGAVMTLGRGLGESK